MRKPNKKGCVLVEDVCLKHSSPRICKHGCAEAILHKCKKVGNNLEKKI